MSRGGGEVAAVQAAGDAIIAADTDGKILLWNPAAERIFGFTAEDASATPLSPPWTPMRFEPMN